MLTIDELRSIPLLASLGGPELESVSRSAGDLQLGQGDHAAHEGDEAALLIVMTGRLEIYKLVDGIERKIGERLAGKIHGEVPLIYGTRFMSSARAAEPSRVMQLEARAYYALAASVPAIALAVGDLAKERIGGLQAIAAEEKKPQAIFLGDPQEARGLELRRFLDRNHISYQWLSSVSAEDVARWRGEAVTARDHPAIHCLDGTTLRRPKVRDLAERLGVQTAPRHADYDTVIIGGGPAGLAAAVYGASEGLRTIVIEREAPGGQAGTSSRIENYLGFPSGISGDELADRAHRQASRLGAEILMTRRTIGIDLASRAIVLDDEETVRARTIIIATGVSWRRVPIEGFDGFVGKGVCYGAARTDAKIAQGQDVHLIGAGNSAGQAALFLANYARRVTLIVRGDSLEKSMSQYLIDQIRTKPNIVVALRSEITAVHGADQLAQVDIHDASAGATRREDSVGVFVFIGADAETGWLPEEILRDKRGYVLTGIDLPRDGAWPEERDPFLLETSVPGIFACGDVRLGPVKRVAAAVGDGSMAIAFVHQYLRHEAMRKAED